MTAIGWKRSGAVVGRPGKAARRKRALTGAVEALEPRVVMATFMVTSAADTGPGTLRDAITQANRVLREAHVISIAPEVSGPIVLNSALPTLVGEVELSGPEGTQVAIVRSNAPDTPEFRLLTVGKSAKVTVNRLAFSGGQAQFGGGILNDGQLLLMDSDVSGNVAGAKGGGIYNTGAITIGASSIRDNVAEGVRSIGFGPAGIGRGGAIFNSNSLTLSSSSVTGNSTNREGGAIWNSGWTSINTSLFAGNSAEAFVAAPGRVPIGRGGAVYNTSVLHVNGSTLTDNLANQQGGAVYSNVTRPRIEPSSITSSIVADNVVDDVFVRFGPFEFRGPNLVGKVSGRTTGTISMPGVDPMLAPLGLYGGSLLARPPLPGSPAIGAGLFNPAFQTDMRGAARSDGATDLGALQALPFSLLVESGSGQEAMAGEPFAAPIVVRLVAEGGGGAIEGGQVVFTAPAEGASAVLVGNPARVNAEGIAEIRAIANGIPGTFEVVVESAGAEEPVTVTLTNVDPGPGLGDPAPTSSAELPIVTTARQAVEDLRTALPRPSQVAPTVRARAAALARELQQSLSSAVEPARSLHPSVARVLDQLRDRNGSSSSPGTPISTT
ncbi:choice-of-anchor Q domain-containing protein [Tautonia rosea]|uniref:choice-of-anchor Q domain-containing protein n=1 Tax=Tautonia rosea TaxID=2728037 RepID=UPI0014741412|nr:choice-of-anchor Q domain-containing protein [Tautonia rosea]